MRDRERHRAAVRLIQRHGYLSVDSLCVELAASPATVRRDLAHLHATRQIRRVRGGAEALDLESVQHGLVGQPSVEIDRDRNAPAKRAIARRAAALCEPGSSIIIDAGTTTAFMGEFLPEHGLAILTSSLLVLETVVRRTRNRVVVPGGEVFREQRMIVSDVDDRAIHSHCASLLFMGAQGVSPRGLLQSDRLLVEIERQLIARADRLVVLADSSKFDGRGSVVLCALAEVDVLVTDAGAPPASVQMLEAAGVEVIIVSADDVAAAQAPSRIPAA